MRIIGIMSGTSVDGIDIVECEIDGKPPALRAQMIQGRTVAYDPHLRERIIDVCAPSTIDELCRLNFEIGEAIAHAILDMVKHPATIDLIASHGQTVWHDVNTMGKVTSTLQIGSGAMLAERTGITTINNFRERDICAGGQGAPLTAYVDWLLLRDATQWRAVQNIGGMANVSFLPPLNSTSTDLIAFDTGPGNVLIDSAVGILTGHRYDHNGDIAANGTIDTTWLAELLAHDYFRQSPPRTTGRELFSRAMAAQLIESGQARGGSIPDIIATITALTAHSIAESYRHYAPAPIQEVVIGGGGVHNQTLLNWLRELLHPAKLLRHEDLGINSDFKEALAFAVLGYETWHQRVGTLPSQTGANHRTILGQITPGQNFQSLMRKTWL